MGILLLLLPLLIVLSSIYLYKHNGKREFLRMDVVQFVYSFVVLPMAFIWMRSFIYVILKAELTVSLSLSEYFFIDVLFSTLFLYVYAFVVIHSLTKSFQIRRYSDPLYDMVAHSEFFHMNVSHLVIYGGTLVLAALFGTINLFVALPVVYSRLHFYSILAFASLTGVIGFWGIWKYESPTPNFMRIMKLLFAVLFSTFIVLYYAFEPDFNGQYSGYWFIFSALLTLVILGIFAERSEKPGRFWYLPFRINPKKIGWYALFMKRRLSTLTEKRS